MNKHDLICPVCEEGLLHEATFADDFKHGDGSIHVDGLDCYVCEKCGADPVFPEQIRRNHLRIADAKRLVDGLLTGAEIKSIRTIIGVSQSEAAQLFGGGANAFSKYERGDVIQSKPMDKLLRLVCKYPFILDDLYRQSGLKKKTDAGMETAKYATVPDVVIESKQIKTNAIKQSKVIQMSGWRSKAAA